jgi:hypothetical protein
MILILFIILILILGFIIWNCLCHQIQIRGGSTNIKEKMTFTISGENGLDFSALRDILKKNNFTERPITDRVHVSFGTFPNVEAALRKSNYDPAFYKQKAAIKNTLGDHKSICDKTLLFKTIKNLIPIGYKYIPSTFSVEEIEKYYKNNENSKKLFMIKKGDSARQMGVLVVTSKEEFIEAKKKLNINQSNGIVSEYIANSRTVDGKKMHLRIYILMTIQSGITRCYIFNEYRIYVAESNYQKSDWLNPKIHISGADSTHKNYKWPDEVDDNKDINTDELNECLRVLCLGMALSNIKNYEESDAGYHLYGADILLTDDNKAYILEVNKRPGFGWVRKEPNPYEYSHRLFTFILNHSVFPYLGIVRQPPAPAEVIVNGVLTPFGRQLISPNRNVLIPLANAKPHEIEKAKTFYFHNERTTFYYLSEYPADEKYIYLIANNNTIIGYLVVLNRWINIAIIKEFQSRGIATAMIAQFMEIIKAQSFTAKESNPIIYIHYLPKSKLFAFMKKIAKRLKFEEKSMYFERRAKIRDSTVANINNHKLLTYNKNTINTKNGFNKEILIQELDHNMVHTEMQFVHLSYTITTAHMNEFMKLKLSTGSKYSNEFITQGAELKSVLFFPKIKFINSYSLLRQYISEMKNNQKYLHLFNKLIDEANIKDNITYQIYDYTDDLFYYTNSRPNILKKIEEIRVKKEQDFNKLKELKHVDYINDEPTLYNKYDIMEYYPPYLLDGKLMILKLFIILYISGNGIKKCYIFDKYIVCTAAQEYSIKHESDWNNLDIISPKMTTTNQIYEWPNYFLDGELKTFIKNNELEEYISTIAKMLISGEYYSYPEANAGFVEFTMNIKFVKKEDGKYYPIIDSLNNIIQIWKFKNMTSEEYKQFEDEFSKNYYHWLVSHVIYPHFGLSKQIKPKALICKNSVIDEEILSSLSLHTNGKKFTNIKIYIDNDHIGDIKLTLDHLSNNIIILEHIELLPAHRKKTIGASIIFLLMDILGAHYAPNNPSLKFINVQQMQKIAHKLEFHKIQESGKEFYIKACRV